MAKIESEHKNRIQEYKYSNRSIKNATSLISRSYPIAQLSADNSTAILKLLAETLLILGVKKIDKIGDIQTSAFVKDIYPTEVVELMASEVYKSYKTVEISAAESTQILTYLRFVRGIIFERLSVPFTYKEIEYNFANRYNEDEVVNLLADTFSKEDKQKCLGLSYAEVRQHMELHIKEEINDENVLVAKDEDGELIGVLSW